MRFVRKLVEDSAGLAFEFAERVGFLNRNSGRIDQLISQLPAAITEQAREGLHRLLWSLKADSDLTAFGRLAIRWDLQRLLRNAIRIESEAQAAAALGRNHIERPIFILGLPRSGKTFLHQLMAQDPGNLVPRVWQAIEPRPRPDTFNARRNATVRKVDRQLRTFGWLSSEFHQVHPMAADSPQECSEITAHVFESFRFENTFHVPSYLDWLDRQDYVAAFRFHRKFLTSLQQGLGQKRWVLECPDHAFMVAAIRHVYPDARFILVHRDPVRFASSAAHVMEVARRPFLSNIMPYEIGARTVAHWGLAARRLVELDRSREIAAKDRVNVYFQDLVRDPMREVERIYTAYGMELSAPAREAMRTFALIRHPGTDPDARRYTPERYGINLSALAADLSQYCRHFDVRSA